MKTSEYKNVRAEYDESTRVLRMYGDFPEFLDAEIALNSIPEASAAEELRFEDGVTQIRLYFLRKLPDLKRIYMADSISSVGDASAAYDMGFSYCKSLEYIRLPSGVGSIDRFWLSECFSIKEVFIPKGIYHISRRLFVDCPLLENIIVDEENTDYMSRDGVLFTNSGATLRKFPCGRKGSYTLPEDTLEIDEYAFENAGIESIVLNKALKRINEFAFTNCRELKRIALPDGLKYLSASAFMGCTGLEGVDVGEENPYFCSKDGSVFSYDKVELILAPKTVSGEYTVPHGITILGQYAFGGCDITKLVIPEDVQFINKYCFTDCGRLEEVVIHTKRPLPMISAYAFYGCGGLKILRYYANDPSLPKKLGIGRFEDQIVYAPDIMLSDVDKAYFPAVAAGFAEMAALREKMRPEVYENADRCIREDVSRLYVRALKNAALLVYILASGAVPPDDLPELYERAVRSGDTQQANFVKKYIDRLSEKTE